ncbi:MAG: hypothetical protein IPL13_00955 [Saprospiraceae bacterium]|nr:hypothetical protein [Candidatus Brachybacter algidus]
MQRINELDELPSFEKYKSNLQNLKNISHLENNLVEIEKYYFKNAIIFQVTLRFMKKTTLEILHHSGLELTSGTMKI